MRSLLVSFFLFLILAFGFGAGSALAEVPACEGGYSQQTIYRGQGTVEAVIAGNSGRLFISSRPDGEEGSALLRYDKPGSDPKVVSESEPGAGGLAWDGHRLLWGNGNNAANGSVGDETPRARLLGSISAPADSRSYPITWAWQTGWSGPATARSSRRTTLAPSWIEFPARV